MAEPRSPIEYSVWKKRFEDKSAGVIRACNTDPISPNTSMAPCPPVAVTMRKFPQLVLTDSADCHICLDKLSLSSGRSMPRLPPGSEKPTTLGQTRKFQD